MNMRVCAPNSAKRSPSDRRGRFIVVEGVDGAGKTSVLRALAARPEGRDAVFSAGFTRRSRWDRFIHAHPASFFYFVDLLWKTFRTVRPALRQGRTVFQDRYVQTVDTYFPDAGFRHNRCLRWLLGPLLLKPDLFVLCVVDPAENVRRLRAQSPSPDGYHETLVADPERLIARQRAYEQVYAGLACPKACLETTGRTVAESLILFLSLL